MIFLVVFGLLVSKSSAYYQEKYRIINERCDLVSYNRSYSDNVTFALSLVNRTTRAFNFRVHLLVDMGMDLKGTAQLYKFLSNEYRFFPATIPFDVCHDLLEKGRFGFDDVKKHSNVDFCPFKKGWYQIRNFIPDYRKYPPHIPFGKYKTEIKFFHLSKCVLELHWYGKVEEIIKWQ